MLKTLSRFFMLSLVVSLLAACGSVNQTPGDKFKGQTAEQIFNGGQTALSKGYYDEAVSHFEGLDALYPFGDYAEQAQLEIIYAYYMSDDAPSAVAASERFIHLHPRNPHVDYAYYMRGIADMAQASTFLQRHLPIDVSRRDLTYSKKAFVDFDELTRLFPDSKYTPDALQRMVYLRNVVAAHNLDIATFYMKRKAYVAASNRASYIVHHFQHAPQVQDALQILYQADTKLGLTDKANEARKIYELNFPGQAIA